MVLGERRTAPGGQPVWLIRAYWNPWATLIFLGPVLMALGGLISLSDRRLRLGVARVAGGAAGRRVSCWRALSGGSLAAALHRRRRRSRRAPGRSGPGGPRPQPLPPGPLPGLPERVHRRLRGRAGRRPAGHCPRAGEGRAQRRGDQALPHRSLRRIRAADAAVFPGNLALWGGPFLVVASGGAGGCSAAAEPRARSRAIGREKRRGSRPLSNGIDGA